MAGGRSLAVVMPSYNEGENLDIALKHLQRVSAVDEVIVVDASDDAESLSTIERCKNNKDLINAWPLRILTQQKASRAVQMNAGAENCVSDILLFLHADTQLPDNAGVAIKQVLTDVNRWGRFNVRLDGREWLLRFVERMMNWRSCQTGIATGDQAMFLTRSVFNDVGGFPNIPLMEDVELSKRLKRVCKPVCVEQFVITSARRWQHSGVLRTIILMWCMRFAYYIGVSPQMLSRFYRQVR